MSEEDRKTEELEEELESEATENEDDYALGESLYGCLKERGLVDEPWDDLTSDVKSKYEEVAVEGDV